MSNITYADKNSGDTFTAVNANEIKTAVNSKRDQQPSTLYITADHTITVSEALANDFFSNYGASAKVHATLPAVAYNLVKTFVVEAAQIIEIVPPSGETLYYKSSVLTADYVVDTSATISSKVVATRIKTGASTWAWSLSDVDGTSTNPGRVHD